MENAYASPSSSDSARLPRAFLAVPLLPDGVFASGESDAVRVAVTGAVSSSSEDASPARARSSSSISDMVIDCDRLFQVCDCVY